MRHGNRVEGREAEAVMRVLIALVVAIFGLVGSAFASEPSCYASAAEAVAQVGVRGVVGYRLEGTRRDLFSGSLWATVRDCGHPERPALLVMASLGSEFAPGLARRVEISAQRAIVMTAGSRVRLVESDGTVQLEVSAIAQGNAAIGDRIRVRLLPVSSDSGLSAGTSWAANEQFATGIVRSRGVVEMETR